MNNKQIIQKLNDNFSTDAFIEYCAEDVTWNLMGAMSVTGKEALRQEWSKHDDWERPTITTRFLVEEGDMVVSEGNMKMSKKDASETWDGGFVDIYRFKDGKIGEINSYMAQKKA